MFRCAYHVVWCPKYRRKVLVGKVDERLKELRAEVVEEKQGWLVEVETTPDHVHLLVEVDPQFGIRRMVKAIKGRAGRLLRQELPYRAMTRAMWSPSWCVSTVGGAPLSVVKRYVENQKVA